VTPDAANEFWELRHNSTARAAFIMRNLNTFAVGAESQRGAPMHTYEIEVERDGRWWMIRIPELDGLTQARWPSEIKRMAREYIAVSTDQNIRDIAVRVVKRSKHSS
jgi:hypothetical protein